MKIGIGVPTSHQGMYLPSPFAGPDEIVEIARLAERLGFHSAWGLDFMAPRVDEQKVPGQQPEWHEILISLAYLAAHTKTIRLGSASVQLPLRDPFLLAKQAATIDVFSGGRMMLGLGVGTARTEFVKMYPQKRKFHRGRLFVESVEAMHRFFTEDDVTYEGEFYQCEGLCLIPKPIQSPFPMYLAGTTEDTPRRIAKWGSGWLLARKQIVSIEERIDSLLPWLEAEGRGRSEIDLLVTKGLSLGKTREEAFTRFQNSIIPKKMDSMAAAIGVEGTPSQDLDRIYEQNLIGTPDDVIEQLQAVKDRGLDHCVIYYFAVNDFREMMDQVQWFGESVMPAFRS